MQYKKFGKTILARIDKGEEIISSLKKICGEQGVTLAHISALGATGEFTVGVFNTAEKKYYSNTFKGDYEIVSLTGTVTQKDGSFYAHLHMSAGDAQGKVFGGHLNAAVVSATCEMTITLLDGEVNRAFDEETGLNLMEF